MEHDRHVTVRIPAELAEQINMLAGADGIKLSAEIRRLLAAGTHADGRHRYTSRGPDGLCATCGQGKRTNERHIL